jgi:hypothetical protein
VKFAFEGKSYQIQFRRLKKRVAIHDKLVKGVLYPVESTHFFTEGQILEVDPKAPRKLWKVFRTATVGAWHKEKKVTGEIGRLRALKLITRTLPKGMKPLMWKAYLDRAMQPKVDPTPTPQAAPEGDQLNLAYDLKTMELRAN